MADRSRKIRKPSALRKGDVIGIIAPASPPHNQESVERGARYFERLGYRVEIGAGVSRKHGYLAGRDRERLDDLHAMFADRRINAIVCARGGYGTPRLLQSIDYNLIARNPKILVGFSDITALQLALWKKCRLVTFHGPMLAVEFASGLDSLTEQSFWKSVTSTHKRERISLPSGTTVLHRGKASGVLLGGNLSLITSILGTPFQPDFQNALLFFEDVGEEPYRIDRMITQLSNASVLQKAAGVLAGKFSDCVPKDPTKPSLSVSQILGETASTIEKPFLSNLPFGHTTPKLTLPIGVTANLVASRSELRLEEPAVL